MQKKIAFILLCTLLYNNIQYCMMKDLDEKDPALKALVDPNLKHQSYRTNHSEHQKSKSKLNKKKVPEISELKPKPYLASPPEYSEVKSQPNQENIPEHPQLRPTSYQTAIPEYLAPRPQPTASEFFRPVLPPNPQDIQDLTNQEVQETQEQNTSGAKTACLLFGSFGSITCAIITVATFFVIIYHQ